MTEAQLNARRENAKLSTGPTTQEGKKRSSLNAFRHGLTGQIVVQTLEDQEAFNKHCDGIREALAPVGALELDLAQAIAEDRWRLNRARALENSIFALGQTEHVPDDSDNPDVDAALAQGRTWIAHARELQLLSIYENRIRRSVEKNTAELRALQAQRKFAPVEAQLRRFLNARFEGGNDDPAGDVPAEIPDSSVCFFEDRDSASDQPEPERFTEKSAAPPPKPATRPSRQEPPQRTTGRPEPRNNRPEPTRQPTMDDVRAIIGDFRR
ncbi:MAG TPA: hypothetical protein VIY49_37030 [Bryobacteraceae bacterium]